MPPPRFDGGAPFFSSTHSFLFLCELCRTSALILFCLLILLRPIGHTHALRLVLKPWAFQRAVLSFHFYAAPRFSLGGCLSMAAPAATATTNNSSSKLPYHRHHLHNHYRYHITFVSILRYYCTSYHFIYFLFVISVSLFDYLRTLIFSLIFHLIYCTISICYYRLYLNSIYYGFYTVRLLGTLTVSWSFSFRPFLLTRLITATSCATDFTNDRFFTYIIFYNIYSRYFSAKKVACLWNINFLQLTVHIWKMSFLIIRPIGKWYPWVLFFQWIQWKSYWMIDNTS